MLLLFSRMLKTPPGVEWPFEPVLMRRAANEDAIAIHVHGLLGNAHQDHERTAR